MRAWHELVRRAQQGDLGASDGLVSRFRDMAVGYSYSLLRDFHLAEDAAQEAIYSMAEVGQFLDVPTATVKSRLHSARRRLKERTMGMVRTTLTSRAPGEELNEKVRRVMGRLAPWPSRN
jgi:DNA-directed RNA polymerase specialized sigma24 family protein